MRRFPHFTFVFTWLVPIWWIAPGVGLEACGIRLEADMVLWRIVRGQGDVTCRLLRLGKCIYLSSQPPVGRLFLW